MDEEDRALFRDAVETFKRYVEVLDTSQRYMRSRKYVLLRVWLPFTMIIAVTFVASFVVGRYFLK
jgi:hypothetical protein